MQERSWAVVSRLVAAAAASAAMLSEPLAGVPGPEGAGSAAAANADRTERAAIDGERAAAEARYRAADRACRDRFLVSSCLDDAKRERRAALDALRARQLAVDERMRRSRAQTRHDEIAAKAADDERRDRERAGRPADPASAAAKASATTHGTWVHREATAGSRERMTFAAPAGRRASESTPSRAEREAQSEAAFEDRQKAAAAHRAEVEARQEESARRAKKPSPLLPPPAASAIGPGSTGGARPGASSSPGLP